MDFFEVTGGRFLKRPIREPRPLAQLRPGGDSAPEERAYAPEGTEKSPSSLDQ